MATNPQLQTSLALALRSWQDRETFLLTPGQLTDEIILIITPSFDLQFYHAVETANPPPVAPVNVVQPFQ